MLRQPKETSKKVLVIASSSLKTRDNLAFNRAFFYSHPPPPSRFIFSNKDFTLCWSPGESSMKIDGEIKEEQRGREGGLNFKAEEKIINGQKWENCYLSTLPSTPFLGGRFLGLKCADIWRAKLETGRPGSGYWSHRDPGQEQVGYRGMMRRLRRSSYHFTELSLHCLLPVELQMVRNM